MGIASLQKLIESYGMTGSIVAVLIAIVLVIAGLYFARSALKLIFDPTEIDLVQMVLAWVRPAIVAIPLIGFGALLAGIVLSPRAPWVIAYALVFAFGGAVGAAELIS